MRLLALLIAVPLWAQPPSTNLIARYVAGTGVTSAGSPLAVSQWNDQTSNHYDLTQATGANQPLDAVDLDNRPVVRFQYGPTGSKPTIWLTNASLPLNTNLATMCVIRSDYLSANFPGATQSYLSLYTYPTGMLGEFWNTNGGTHARGSLNGVYTVHPPMNKTLLCGTFGSSFTAYTIDQTGTTSATSAANETGMDVGRRQNTAIEYISGDIYEILVYNATLSSTVINQIRTYAIGTYGLQSGFTKQVVMVGDSNMEGSQFYGASFTGENFPRRVARSAPTWAVFNYGKFSTTLQADWLSTNFQTDVDKIIISPSSPLSGRNVALIMIGTNDINSNGRTAAQVFADLKTWVTARKTSGWEVWVMTILPLSGPAETVRQAYNALLVDPSQYTVPPDKVIDFRSDPFIGSSPMNASYQVGDNVHVNQAGATILAWYVANALSPSGSVKHRVTQ